MKIHFIHECKYFNNSLLNLFMLIKNKVTFLDIPSIGKKHNKSNIFLKIKDYRISYIKSGHQKVEFF
jgi:hypothetical protein